MTFEVRITQAAWADVERIHAWIRDQKQAPLTADRWFNAWLKSLRGLEAFPGGRSRAPENGTVLGVEIHQHLFGSFRTLYVIQDKTVFVVHIRRASRKAATIEEIAAGVDEASDSTDG